MFRGQRDIAERAPDDGAAEVARLPLILGCAFCVLTVLVPRLEGFSQWGAFCTGNVSMFTIQSSKSNDPKIRATSGGGEGRGGGSEYNQPRPKHNAAKL